MATKRYGNQIYFLDESFQPQDLPVLKDIQVLKSGTFYDPRYKQFDVTAKMLQEMVSNFRNGVRGVVPALDYDHDTQGPAAGWFKELYIKDIGPESQLWAKIEFTPRGQKSLSDKDYGYISADFEDAYEDNETGRKYGCVLKGAALTNRPVIKRMEPVIQLSEKDAVSEKIAKLIDEGYPQEQAVAIASQMERDGKLSELNPNQGGTVQTDDQKKLADLEAQCADMQKKLGDYKKLEEEMGVDGIEALMSKIAEMKKGPAQVEVEVEKKDDMEKQLSETKEKLVLAEKKLVEMEKETEFTKLLSEGKAVAAQREAYLAGDMKKFIELSEPMKMEEQGVATTPKDVDDVDGEIEKLAKKLAEEKKLTFKEAVSEVLRTNKSLAEKRK